MEALVNRRNNVLAKQKAMQAYNGKTLVFLRGRGKLYFSAYMVLFTAGLGGSLFQLSQYVVGNAKKAEEAS